MEAEKEGKASHAWLPTIPAVGCLCTVSYQLPKFRAIQYAGATFTAEAV